MKLFQTIKANVSSHIKVPHPTLVLLAIGAGISAITVGIFYMADSSGMFGQDAAEAAYSNKRLRRP